MTMTGQDNRPNHSRASLRRHLLISLLLGLALVGGVGGWAYSSSLASAVITSGKVVVDSNVKKVQHSTGGIVGEILVRDGDTVSAGQVLLRLDETMTLANLKIIKATLAQLLVRRARLEAERGGAQDFDVPEEALALVPDGELARLFVGERALFNNRGEALAGMRSQLSARKEQLREESAGLDVQIAAADEMIALIEQELVGVAELYQKQLVGIQRVSALKRDLAEITGNRGSFLASRAQAEGRASEIELQILQLDQDMRKEVATELTEIERSIAEYQERRIAAEDQLRRVDIRAPQSGRVYRLGVHTIQGVINPGEVLMLIVPDGDELDVEAPLDTRHIDQVYVGQPVTLRFAAFNQQTTPEIEGVVTMVAPDLVSDDRTGQAFYPLRIRPDSDSLTKLGNMSLYPGMPVEIFIRTGERSVMSYLFKPMMDQIAHAMREP
jgi:membrane fusion protein